MEAGPKVSRAPCLKLWSVSLGDQPMQNTLGFVPFFPVSGKRFTIAHPDVAALPDAGLPRLLRDARLKCGLSKRSVALKIGVTSDVIGYWERGKHVPRIHYMPTIISFLGDDTWLPVQTFADRLYKVRALRGWPQAKLAAFFGYDERSVARWESGTLPPRKTKDLIEELIASKVADGDASRSILRLRL